MTQTRVPGLDPAIQERAQLTDKQAQALALWNPDPSPFKRRGGYGSVARVLGITTSGAREHVTRALVKVAAAMDEEPVTSKRLPESVGVDPFA